MKKIFPLYVLATLTVGCGSGSKSVGSAPTIEAGADIFITYQPEVLLTGAAQDKDSDIDSTKWTQLSGPEDVSIDNNTSLTASFTTPNTSGQYEFQLTVKDKKNHTVQDKVTVTVDLKGGIWQTIGHGEMVNIKSETIENFQFTTTNPSGLTTATCLLSKQHKREEVEQEYGIELSADKSELKIDNTTYYRVVDGLPGSCSESNRIKTIEEDGYQYSAKQHLDIVFNNASEFYPFFALRAIDQTRWNDHFVAIRDQLPDNATDEQLFEALAGLLSIFEETQVNGQLIGGDGHVSLLKPDPNSDDEQEYSAISEDVFTQQVLPECESQALSEQQCEQYLSQEQENYLDVLSSYLDPDHTTMMRGSDDGALMVFSKIIDRPIGFMLLQSMSDMVPDDSTEELDYLTATHQLMARYVNDLNEAGINKLIIDLRMNGGGYDEVSLAIASYFVRSRQQVAGVQTRVDSGAIDAVQLGELKFNELPSPRGDIFDGDVIILTSRSTGSAAEMLVAYLAPEPATLIVGENTRGNFSAELWKTLPNGWFFSIANEVVRFPDTHGVIDAYSPVYEGTGFPINTPSVIQYFTTEDRAQAKDSALDYVLAVTNQ